ncbi:uncharacterized protein [Gorilla gorilla gorilla]|uniref:uncharacterized protein n=1 Tax=Gorilla gorilla gorilla TaxID=9595 RepID=UPI00300A2727
MNLSDSLVCWALAGRHLGRDQGLRLAHRQREHLVHPPLDLGRDPRERAGPLAGPRHQHLALGVPVGLGAHQHQQDGPGFPQPAQALAQRPHGRERGLAAHAREHREAVAVADVQVLERDQGEGLEIITGPTQNYSFPELTYLLSGMSTCNSYEGGTAHGSLLRLQCLEQHLPHAEKLTA